MTINITIQPTMFNIYINLKVKICRCIWKINHIVSITKKYENQEFL